MTPRAVAVAVIVAAAVGAALAWYVGTRGEPAPAAPSVRPTDEVRAPDAPPPPPTLAEAASPDEAKLWTRRGCVTCHGSDGHGSMMGPDLAPVLSLYLQKFVSRDAALQPLTSYIFDPKSSAPLRKGEDGEFMVAMPGVASTPGGTRAEAETLARLLLRIAR